MSQRQSDRDRLKDLLEQCLTRMERQGPQALDAFCDEHPQQAEALRRRVAALAGAGLLEEQPA